MEHSSHLLSIGERLGVYQLALLNVFFLLQLKIGFELY